MLTKQQKRDKIDVIREKINAVDYIFFVSFSGVPTKSITKLRDNLYTIGSHMTLVKKTLADIAFKEAEIKGFSLKKDYDGQVAIIFSGENLFASLAFLNDFKKQNKDKFSVLGAVVNKNMIDSKSLTLFNSIRSLDDLYTRLVWSIKYPISQLAMVLDQVAKK